MRITVGHLLRGVVMKQPVPRLNKSRVVLANAGIFAAVTIIAALAPSVQGAQTQRATSIYSGNGGKTLPPIQVKKPSTLFWTASGGIFQIFSSSSNEGGSVNS
jgi:hypothetical protein